MRVLQINCVYNTGSTGKIVYDLHNSYLEKNINSYVCYGRGKKSKDRNVFKTANEISAKGNNFISRLTGMQYNGSYFATKKLIKKLKRINPDVVHLHCINGYFVNIFKLLSYLKKNNVPTVLTLHAEFMYTGNCGYALECDKWKNENGCHHCYQLKMATGSYFIDRTHSSWLKMKKSFYNFTNLEVVSVSPWLEKRAKESVILKNITHSCIFNGIDVDNIFYYRKRQAIELRKNLHLENKKVVLYVTAGFSQFKGADYVIELAKKMPDVVFLVIGNIDNVNNTIHNIVFLGRIENQVKLAEYYSMADISILTSKKETFSMVCAESLSCGTPIVGFKAGAPEEISIPEYSKFCEYGNIELLKICLEKALFNIKYFDKEKISKQAKKIYSKNKMSEEYLKIYKRFCDEK